MSNTQVIDLGPMFEEGLGGELAPCESTIARTQYVDHLLAQIAEATSHLRVALLQAHPDDDQIILEHVREALKLLEE